MGASRCSQFCQREPSERIGCEKWARRDYCLCSDQDADGCVWKPLDAEPVAPEELSGLGYMPPPRAEVANRGAAMVGTEVPKRPPVGKVHGVPPSLAGSSSRYSTSRYPTCARPGEPVNQVFVQFSNDLEGFLPYTLVISEEHGLEFTSLSPSPDFVIDPLNIMKVTRVPYDTLMEDTFFLSLAKSVLSRPGKTTGKASSNGFALPAAQEQERVRPPYYSIVQLTIRRTMIDGAVILVFIAVQSEPLAEELVRSCNQLRKRRAVRYTSQKFEDAYPYDVAVNRGVLSARSLGTRTPQSVSPARTPPHSVSPARTPPQGATPVRTPQVRSPRRTNTAPLSQPGQAEAASRSHGSRKHPGAP